MTFAEWFTASYRKPDEPLFRAIHRMAADTGLGWTTVHRALKGTRLQLGNARALSGLTGGQVTVDSLHKAPTRKEVGAQHGEGSSDENAA